MILENMGLMLAVWGAVTASVLLIYFLLSGNQERVESRLADLSTRDTRQEAQTANTSVLGKIGAFIAPKGETNIGRMRSRMMQAGLYQRHTTALFLGVKVLLMVSPMAVGLALAAAGMMTWPQGVGFGALVGLLGTVVPNVWLKRLKAARQRNLRRAMPDALDVIVVCLEGGLSLPGALQRVASELKHVHPLLAAEMSIVRREIQLGCSTGEALQQFADRFDAEEIRSLASIVSQAERYGASITRAMRIHADTLRLKRYQCAEAMAQRAPVQLIFPTVLCIFPALYIVLMGPAGVQLFEMLDKMA